MLVLIFFDKEEQEIATVCDRIKDYGCDFLAIDLEEFIGNYSVTKYLTKTGEQFEFKHFEDLETSEICGIWYRRNSELWRTQSELIHEDGASLNGIKNQYANEVNAIKRIFWRPSAQINFLSSYETFHIDKYFVLRMAAKIGLHVPETLVTNSKSRLLEFAGHHKAIITKAGCENIRLRSERKFYMQYVEEVTIEKIETFPEKFFPSIFQERIYGDFEIRAFYLDGNFFSSAILTNGNLDYRESSKYRIVPYKLPDAVENKLTSLMGKLGFNTGGIDIIKRDEEYYFLEINPSGYFGKNSYSCNYALEDKIAQYLVYGTVEG